MSKLRHLECYDCKKKFDPNVIQTICPDCQAPLLACYDLESSRGEINRESFRERDPGMWRWHELLPVSSSEYMINLGEGDTPLLSLSNLGRMLGLKRLFLKDESLNPTGTFKSRGMAAAVSKAKELGCSIFDKPVAPEELFESIETCENSKKQKNSQKV